jgi:Chaperone of endosialidase
MSLRWAADTRGRAIPDVPGCSRLIPRGGVCAIIPESFGFDTIRLKENNTRLKFDDTSTLSGFPANDWQLTANDSAAGGANKFSIEDVTGAKVPFTITAGAPSNSMFVDSSGRFGLRTATPVLDVHIATGNTPAHRLEQNASNGFTAQTWDMGGNEANFFIRDVTGGSRLPFRIRPGAPTSSIDISASGKVGVSTTSPSYALQVNGTEGNGWALGVQSTDATLNGRVLLGSRAANAGSIQGVTSAGAVSPLLINPDGANVGIGTSAPTARLHTVGTVRLAGIANCGSGIQSNANGDLSCVVSSRQFKNITGDLAPTVALANVMALRPQTGAYKETPDVPEHWLIAEDVAAVDPALAGLADGKPYVVKTQNVVADLVAVVQQQQRRIDELERKLAAK